MYNTKYVMIKEIGKVITGKTPSTEDENNFSDDFPFITPSDIPTFNEKYIAHTERGISSKAANNLKNNRLPKNSVCFVSIGSTIGKMCFTKEDSFTNQQINSLVVSEKYNAHYVFYLLRYIRSYFQQLGAGTGSGKGIVNKTTFEKTKICVLDDKLFQDKIADYLSTYDELIENNNKRIAILEQMAENIYKEWFVRFRFPGYETTEFENGIPKDWRVAPVKETFEIFDIERIPVSSMDRDKMQKIYPYYGAAELMDYVDDYLFDGVYLLIGEDGSVITPKGKPVLQYVWGKFWVNNHAHVLQGKNPFSTEFLHLMFGQMDITGIVTGSAQPKISQGRLFKKKTIIPNIDLVKQFDEIIQPIYQKIRNLKESNKNLTKQRDLLLPRLMSGKLEV